MSNRKFRLYIMICSTFLLALILTMLPLPGKFSGFRPNWLTLILIYWVFFSPNLVGVITGFISGLCMDLLTGVVLGSSGVVLAFVAFLGYSLRSRIKQLGFWQRFLLVAILVGIQQLLYIWLQMFLERTVWITNNYVWPLLLSIACWPLLYGLLYSYQKRSKLL